MSAGAVILQFSNLLKHAESLGPKLSTKIRPNKDQLKEIQTLCTKLKDATASIESHVERLMQKTAPNDKELELLNRLRSSKYFDQSNPTMMTTLRKNLVLIFRGPDVSALNTDDMRSRRDKTQTRCELLRKQNPSLILRWSITFQPSKWNLPTVMAASTFDFLVNEMKTVALGPIPSQFANTIKHLEQEEPLKSCVTFHEFVQTTINTMTTHQALDAVTSPLVITTENQRQDVVPLKRKSAESPYDDRQEKIKLIKRSNEIDYKGSAMPAGNLPLLIQRLPTAIGSSKQWKFERQLFANKLVQPGEKVVDRTDCLSAFVPTDRDHDVSINIVVGYEAGVALIDDMDAQIIGV